VARPRPTRGREVGRREEALRSLSLACSGRVARDEESDSGVLEFTAVLRCD
jgi:hypothetical protein